MVIGFYRPEKMQFITFLLHPMNIRKIALRLPLAGALALLAFGCSTKESRIKEKSDVFASLALDQQQVIRNGYIMVGFTPDMVYMALDKPERVLPGNGPGNETWVYHNFYAADGSSSTSATVAAPAARTAGRPSSTGAGGAGGSGGNFQIAYDPSADNIKAEAAIKVHVKFVDGKVADIQIVNNGKV